MGYSPRHTDGIVGEIMTSSSLRTIMKKTCADINLSTSTLYSANIYTQLFDHSQMFNYTNYNDIRNINLIFP